MTRWSEESDFTIPTESVLLAANIAHKSIKNTTVYSTIYTYPIAAMAICLF